MGDCRPDPQNPVTIENVEAGTAAEFFMRFDFVRTTKGCQYLTRVVLGPSLEGVQTFVNATDPPPDPLLPSGSCAGGFGDLIFVNANGSLAETPGKRWMQVTFREQGPPDIGLDVPLVLSHHKSLQAMPIPYRRQVDECL